jgi:hypothetical protein
MKMSAAITLSLMASGLLYPPPAQAQMDRIASELSAQHEIARGWGSELQASGSAYMLFDAAAGRIVELVMTLEGIGIADLAPAGPDGASGAIHIHNYPQGGPDFFVQQLPGTLTETATGIEFRLENWVMEDPLGRKHDGIDAAFVMREVVAGNAYFGVHTIHAACPAHDTGAAAGTCAAPATALSGHLGRLPEFDPMLLAGYRP